MAVQVLVKRTNCVWAVLWIGFVVSVVTSPSVLAQSTLSPEAKTALQEGIAAAKFQNWDSAQTYFDAALAAAPRAPEVLFNLGLLNDRKGGAELVASAWYRAYLAAVPTALNRPQIEARLIELHASAEATAAKYMATAKEAARQLAPTVPASVGDIWFNSDTIGDPQCNSEFVRLLNSEMISGRFESADEVVDWFQGNECQNYFRYSVVAAMLALGQPQQAFRHIEKISGPWKVSALNLLAAITWRDGDKTGAIKLVKEAEAAATQLVKGFGESSTLTDRGNTSYYDADRRKIRYNTLRLSSELAIAWCLVGNTAKARHAINGFDQIMSAYEADAQYASIFDSSLLELTLNIVVATHVLSGKDKEAKAAIGALVSRINVDTGARSAFKNILDKLMAVPHKDLIAERDPKLSAFYRLPVFDRHGWSKAKDSFIKLIGNELIGNVGELDSWSSIAMGQGYLTGDILYGDVYRNGEKFLATASGSETGNAITILSEGSADLLLGSRRIKEIAEAWRKEGADSAQ